jgi:hypothetical protein
MKKNVKNLPEKSFENLVLNSLKREKLIKIKGGDDPESPLLLLYFLLRNNKDTKKYCPTRFVKVL